MTDPVPLRHNRDFLRFWLADTLSQFGARIGVLALPLVAVVTLRASPLEVAVLTAVERAAFAVVGLPAGVWSDRVPRRAVLIGTDLARLAAYASVPVAAVAGVLTMGQMVAVALVSGACTVGFEVAHQSYLPALVGRAQLIEGNSRLAANTMVAATIGPAAAGYLVQWLTAPLAVAVNAVCFAWSAGWIRAIRTAEAPPAERPASGRPDMRREIGDGVRFVLGDPLLRALVRYGATWCAFDGISQTVRILFLVRELHLSPGAVGLLFGAGSIGGLLGALGAARLTRAIGDRHRAVVWYAMVTGLAGLLIPLTGTGVRLVFFAVGWAGVTFGVVAYNTVQVSLRQAACPDHLLGRMNATIRTLTWSAVPVGALLGGVLVAWLGLRGALWVGAIGTALAPVCLIGSRRASRLRPATAG